MFSESETTEIATKTITSTRKEWKALWIWLMNCSSSSSFTELPELLDDPLEPVSSGMECKLRNNGSFFRNWSGKLSPHSGNPSLVLSNVRTSAGSTFIRLHRSAIDVIWNRNLSVFTFSWAKDPRENVNETVWSKILMSVNTSYLFCLQSSRNLNPQKRNLSNNKKRSLSTFPMLHLVSSLLNCLFEYPNLDFLLKSELYASVFCCRDRGGIIGM